MSNLLKDLDILVPNGTNAGRGSAIKQSMPGKGSSTKTGMADMFNNHLLEALKISTS